MSWPIICTCNHRQIYLSPVPGYQIDVRKGPVVLSYTTLLMASTLPLGAKTLPFEFGMLRLRDTLTWCGL